MDIEIVEVGPRDGLQNEAGIVATFDKLRLIEALLAAGTRRMEVTSFVNPRRVPQMADAEAVAAGLPAGSGATFIGLAMNRHGVERALATNVDEIGAVCVSTDGFAAANQGQTSAESVDQAVAAIVAARLAGRSGQATIAGSFGCPYEGEVDEGRVVAIAEQLAAAAPREVALADTIGVAVPTAVRRLAGRVARAIGPVPVRIHLHNTRNTGMANVWAAVEAGVRIIDASIGGLGGCPFAPGAAGNVPTEDVVYLLERSGMTTGLDLDRLIAANGMLAAIMGRSLPGMVARTKPFPP